MTLFLFLLKESESAIIFFMIIARVLFLMYVIYRKGDGLMEFKIEEITYFRGKTNHYTIYDIEGDIHLIYGTFYRKVVGGPLYDSTIAFFKGDISWKTARKNIERSRDSDIKEERDQWTYMTKDEFDKIIVDVEELYVDGEKRELDLVEKLM